MGCCTSSPHAKRLPRYRDPADLDEEYVTIRYFGTNRSGSNLVPDDIPALPSTHILQSLPGDSQVILYQAEIDHGRAWRAYRPLTCLLLSPVGWAYVVSKGFSVLFTYCVWDEACCWLRKEYSTRMFFRVYPNRIEYNSPKLRCPYGLLGCGSWNGDHILVHPFDRGAFGFQAVRSCTKHHLCCVWPLYGDVVARHRCQCNGPLWNRMFTDCGGWWCDEWICKLWFCSYQYTGFANGEEVAFASSIALQAYFEGRSIGPDDMKKCIAYWKSHISEQSDPIGRKRPVCCEPYFVPIPTCAAAYRMCHIQRDIPYEGEECTDEIKQIYGKYELERRRQIEVYSEFKGPVRSSTVCRAGGCRRVFGRKGFCFCTEGCCKSSKRKAGEPAPPFDEHYFDDECDASTVLMKVLGPPPANVVIKRWRWDAVTETNVLEIYPPPHNTEKQVDSLDLGV